LQELFQRQVANEGIIGTESTANDSTIVVNNLENRIAQLLNEHASEAAIKEIEDTTEITSESSTSNSMANTSSSTGSKKNTINIITILRTITIIIIIINYNHNNTSRNITLIRIMIKVIAHGGMIKIITINKITTKNQKLSPIQRIKIIHIQNKLPLD